MVILKKAKVIEPPCLYNLFDEINYDVFGDELERPLLGVTYLPDIAGFYLFDRGTHSIFIALGVAYEQGMRTLIHEMVHLYQAQNNIELGHGKEFIKLCRKAETFYNFPRRSIEGTQNSAAFDEYFKTSKLG